MPFGLKNALVTFQRHLIDQILSGLQEIELFIFGRYRIVRGLTARTFHDHNVKISICTNQIDVSDRGSSANP